MHPSTFHPLPNLTHSPQIEYHPYLLTHLAPVLAIQKAHGIITEAYGPLSPLLRHPTGGPLKPILTRIAERVSRDTGKKVDEAGVLLLWTRGTGVVAVSASGNPERIKQLAVVDTLPDLQPAELIEISQVGAKVHYRAYVSRYPGLYWLSHWLNLNPLSRLSTWRWISLCRTSRPSEHSAYRSFQDKCMIGLLEHSNDILIDGPFIYEGEHPLSIEALQRNTNSMQCKARQQMTQSRNQHRTP